MLILFILLFLNVFIPSQTIQNVVCGGSFASTSISNGDYAFFRSPAFPKTASNGTGVVYCRSGFQTDNGNYLWLAMFNGATGGIAFDSSSYSPNFVSFYNSNYNILTTSSTSSSLYFQTSQTNNPKWTAFEAVVLSYNPISSCPFAEKNITLASNMIIPIASDFGPEKIHASCGWTFVIDANQKLKVVMKQLKIISGFSFTLTTDGSTIKSFNSPVAADNPEIHYFSSTSGIFQFNMNNANSSNSNFLAFISMVDTTITPSNKVCKSENATSNYITVSNIDYQIGYNASDNCHYTFSIPTKKELLLHVDNLLIEKNADTLIMKNNSNQFALNNVSYYHLMSDFDGSVIQFSSDGNTQQAGFIFHYNVVDCKCANATFVVPCSGGTLYPTPADHLYCSSLKCNYTIVKDSSCPYNHFTLKLNLKMRDSLDFINVYLNGQFNEKLTSINSNRKVYSFNSNPLLEFSSGNNGNGLTNFENSWSIDINYGDPINKLLTKNLTTTNPTYAVWLDNMNFNDAVIICAPSGNTLQMFLLSSTCNGNLSNYGLYDSQNLDNFVFNLDSPNICSTNQNTFQSKASTSGCFTLYKLYTTAAVNTTLFFRLKEVHSKNCAGANSVIQVYENISLTFSATAETTGTCEISILSASNQDYFGVQLNQFSPSSDGIFTIKSPINQNKILDLNSSESLYYLPLSFYSPVLSIVIPNGKTLTLNVKTFTGTINVASIRAVLASPSYLGFTKTFSSYLYYINPYDYVNNNFVVKELKSSAYVYYSYVRRYYYFKENDNVTLDYDYRDFYSTETDLLHGGFLIELYRPNAVYRTTYATYPPSTRYPTITPYATYPPSTRYPTITPYWPISSTFPGYNKLICLTKTGTKICSLSDYYCAFLAQGANVLFQGCSVDLNQITGMTSCTGDVYTTDEKGDLLQCCSTNRCNTGKQSSSYGTTPASGRPPKSLICLNNGQHETCNFNDNFCAYLSGTYKGTETLFQGCSADLNKQTGLTMCTANVFTDGSTSDETYTLQCCDTNNCNTGKKGTGNNGNTGGDASKPFLSLGFPFLLLITRYCILKNF